MRVALASSTKRTEHGYEVSAVTLDQRNLFKVAKLYKQKSLKVRMSNFSDETNETMKPILQLQLMPSATDHSKDKTKKYEYI